MPYFSVEIMDRISDLERKYVLEALDNGFRASRKNIFNRRLEKEFSEKFGINYAIAHVNGTCTMHSALSALGVKSGDEVIVPSLTMSSPSLAVLHNNSVPVFADVDANTFNIDSNSVRKCITPKTKAIISVALYGLPPDYDELLKICNEHGLFLIEDNALCFSGTYHGKIVGSFGHFASHSFQGSKHISSGEGGMLITNYVLLAEKARRFISLGFNGLTASGSTLTPDQIQNPAFDRHLSLGYNYKMSELCAAVALAQLQRSYELVEQRIAVAKLYDEVVSGCDFLTPQHQPDDIQNTYWTYAMVLNTDKPEKDWYRFKELFNKNGGDSFYAAWKLSYNEPLFQREVQHYENVWQQYSNDLCPTAEYLQPRLIQLKNNYWDFNDAKKQAEILDKTIRMF